MVFNTLNKLKWTNNLKDCKIVILHRGLPENRKIISGEKITELKRSYFLYKDSDREVFIPLHRVIEIKVKGKIIWKRKTHKAGRNDRN